MLHQKKYRRMVWVAAAGALFIAGVWVILSALNENTQFFYNAADVVTEDFTPESDPFRVGGFVAEGSITKTGLTTTFRVEDFEREMVRPLTVTYTGALPDLFREGEGVVVSGSFISPTEIMAKDVLAKHDENYQPEIKYQDEIAPTN